MLIIQLEIKKYMQAVSLPIFFPTDLFYLSAMHAMHYTKFLPLFLHGCIVTILNLYGRENVLIPKVTFYQDMNSLTHPHVTDHIKLSIIVILTKMGAHLMILLVWSTLKTTFARVAGHW